MEILLERTDTMIVIFFTYIIATISLTLTWLRLTDWFFGKRLNWDRSHQKVVTNGVYACVALGAVCTYFLLR